MLKLMMVAIFICYMLIEVYMGVTRPFFNIQTTGEISPAGPIPSPVVTGKIRKIPQLFGPIR